MFNWKRKRVLSMVIVMAIAVNLLTACGTQKESNDSEDLMSDIEKNDNAPIVLTGEQTDVNSGVLNFAANVFVESYENGENTLVSPISILYALGMTTNGANGETLNQMEQVLGSDIASLNEYLYAYDSCIDTWTEADETSLYLANAIWFKDDENLQVNADFLQTNEDYYGAAVYKAPFDDTTLNDINDWTYDQTNGMIEEIISEIPENVIMYLVNGLAFEAQWDEIYCETSVWDGTFTTEEGIEQSVEYLYSEESTYIEGEYETGFVKMYEGGDFAFVGLLPDSGMAMEEYIATLDGARLSELLKTSSQESVDVCMPKIEVEYDTDLNEVMMNLGMVDCFGADYADFSGLGSYTGSNIVIDKILHKTYLTVDEQGTKAGAATAVVMVEETAGVIANSVVLDRPYVYMIVDTHENVPLFIGCVSSVE